MTGLILLLLTNTESNLIYLLKTKNTETISRFEALVTERYSILPVYLENINWGNHSDESATYTAYDLTSVIDYRLIQKELGIFILYIGNGFGCTFHAETNPTTVDKTTIQADGIDVVTISNCPSGVLTITNSQTISGAISGTDTFATTIIGEYHLTIVSEGYEDFTTTIEAI